MEDVRPTRNEISSKMVKDENKFSLVTVLIFLEGEKAGRS
jgi:hypothetical protein